VIGKNQENKRDYTMRLHHSFQLVEDPFHKSVRVIRDLWHPQNRGREKVDRRTWSCTP